MHFIERIPAHVIQRTCLRHALQHFLVSAERGPGRMRGSVFTLIPRASSGTRSHSDSG